MSVCQWGNSLPVQLYAWFFVTEPNTPAGLVVSVCQWGNSLQVQLYVWFLLQNQTHQQNCLCRSSSEGTLYQLTCMCRFQPATKVLQVRTKTGMIGLISQSMGPFWILLQLLLLLVILVFWVTGSSLSASSIFQPFVILVFSVNSTFSMLLHHFNYLGIFGEWAHSQCFLCDFYYLWFKPYSFEFVPSSVWCEPNCVMWRIQFVPCWRVACKWNLAYKILWYMASQMCTLQCFEISHGELYLAGNAHRLICWLEGRKKRTVLSFFTSSICFFCAAFFFKIIKMTIFRKVFNIVCE